MASSFSNVYANVWKYVPKLCKLALSTMAIEIENQLLAQFGLPGT